MASPILYSFVNTQLKESYGERGLVISSMMTLGFCSQIWVPLFTFPTVQGTLVFNYISSADHNTRCA